MLRRLRSWIETANGVVGILGGVASVVIAIFAILIQQEINASDQRRARVDRSIALFDQFASSRAVQHLTTLSGFIEFEVHKRAPDREQTDRIKRLSAEIMATRARSDLDFYDHMIQLVQQVRAIARCGDFHRDQNEMICDRQTIYTLFGDSIVDLFFRLRTAMYCDSFFRNVDLGDFETIVSTYLTDVEAVEVDIYRRFAEVPAEAREAGDYIVLEFGPRDFCRPFQTNDPTVTTMAAMPG